MIRFFFGLFLELTDTIRNGGYPIMGAIITVSVVVWSFGMFKLMYLRRFARARKRFMRNVRTLCAMGTSLQPLGIPEYNRLAGHLLKNRSMTSNRIQHCHNSFREFLIAGIPELERNLSAMNAWISVAPLLGLLGTVMGMITTFQTITEFGVGNPALTAKGISMALLTTQAGLTAAFPGMLFHNFLANTKNKLAGQLLRDGEDIINLIQEQIPTTESPHTTTRGNSRNVP